MLWSTQLLGEAVRDQKWDVVLGARVHDQKKIRVGRCEWEHVGRRGYSVGRLGVMLVGGCFIRTDHDVLFFIVPIWKGKFVPFITILVAWA